jgi:hypothetical protein
MPPAPKNNNPFMGEFLKEGRIKSGNEERPSNYTSRPKSSVFKGVYKAVRIKDINFKIGRSSGESEYSTESNKIVREKLKDIKKDFFTKENKQYITKREVEIKGNQLRRDIKNMSEIDRIATEKFLKEIDEKLK